MTTYAPSVIHYLNETGRTTLAKKMKDNEFGFCDEVRLFFSNLWHANKLSLPAGLMATVTGSTAIGLGGLVIPGPGWIVSGAVALGLTLLGVGLLAISINNALRATWDETMKVPLDSREYHGVDNDLD